MSGQRRNNFNTSYRDRSVVVADNSCVVKPKCQQYPSLNEMLSNFSKVLIVHISFTAVINNGDIGKGIGGIWNSAKKNHIYICNLLCDKETKLKLWPPNNFPTLPQKIFKFFTISPVPVCRSGQAFMVIGSCIYSP